MPALVELTEARTYLGVGTGEPPDPQLQQLIDGLSRRIEDHTGLHYIGVDPDTAAAQLFDFHVGDRMLTIQPARAITKVEATATPADEDSWVVLNGTTDYVAEPLGQAVATRIRFLIDTELPASGRGWQGLSLHVANPAADGMASRWPHQERAELAAYAAVRVTAKWGYGPDNSTVPANVKLALLMWLKDIRTRDQAFFSEDMAEAQTSGGMPDDVEAMLEGGAAAGEPLVEAV